MAVIRLILLVAVLGGLMLLLVQNLSPALPLVFLGMRTQALPLALWIFLSIATGAFTSILIATLLKFTNYFAQPPERTSSQSPVNSQRVRTTPRKESTPYPSSPPPATSKPDYTTSQEFDDWETKPTDDDWDFEEQPQTASAKTAEPQQAPKTASQPGSVYSYNAQEPKNTGVGKTESIYDADYRVIIPPYQPSTTNQADDDDWDFFEDDEFEDENEGSRR
ncbi:hypothetical protein [Trichormus sp. NMC-1]|uniref:hypothetical protein n=1 Tax=Trichormus sp. NMC-1 TaxID=1853259 RepID=UPI0008DC165D|nr:hypothetical protein [Trichormus sp. NMC-1]